MDISYVYTCNSILACLIPHTLYAPCIINVLFFPCVCVCVMHRKCFMSYEIMGNESMKKQKPGVIRVMFRFILTLCESQTHLLGVYIHRYI